MVGQVTRELPGIGTRYPPAMPAAPRFAKFLFRGCWRVLLLGRGMLERTFLDPCLYH